jgi:hypothetical protein
VSVFKCRPDLTLDGNNIHDTGCSGLKWAGRDGEKGWRERDGEKGTQSKGRIEKMEKGGVNALRWKYS